MTENTVGSNSAAIDRRRFLKRAGTVAWATPVIVTLLTETAAASHPSGCIHLDAQCGVWSTSVSPRRCVDVPTGSGSVNNCCTGGTCRPTVRVNGQPCTCQ